jgi:hypothetical protein
MAETPIKTPAYYNNPSVVNELSEIVKGMVKDLRECKELLLKRRQNERNIISNNNDSVVF